MGCALNHLLNTMPLSKMRRLGHLDRRPSPHAGARLAAACPVGVRLPRGHARATLSWVFALGVGIWSVRGVQPAHVHADASALPQMETGGEAEKAATGSGAGSGAEAAASRQANALARGTMSPFCPGRTLADCPSPNAQAWRNDIRTWLNEGVPAAEIRRRLQARHPEADLSGGMTDSWSGWLPWAVGGAALLVLLGIIGWMWRPGRHKNPDAGDEPASGTSPKTSDALDARLDEELEL